jgi:hypothetical protein
LVVVVAAALGETGAVAAFEDVVDDGEAMLSFAFW